MKNTILADDLFLAVWPECFNISSVQNEETLLLRGARNVISVHRTRQHILVVSDARKSRYEPLCPYFWSRFYESAQAKLTYRGYVD